MHLGHRRAAPLASEPTNAPPATVGWWGGLPSADLDSESLAKRLLAAPNLHPGGELPPAFWWSFHQPHLQPLRIAVGPPEARLSARQLPPGKYPLQVVSKVTHKASGQSELSLDYLHDKPGPVAPMEQRGTIFLLHGYNSQKESLTLWAYLLAEVGYRSILVDLRGHGESSGQSVSFGKYEIADLQEVLDTLINERLCDGSVGALGVGLGADLALQWAARDSRVCAVVAIAPNRQPELAFARTAQDRKMSVKPEVLKGALDRAATRLGINWPDWSSEAAVRQLKHPVLLIGGGKDDISTVEDLHLLEQAAPAGSKTLLIPNATRREIPYWFHEIAQPVKSWFGAQLRADIHSSPRHGASD